MNWLKRLFRKRRQHSRYVMNLEMATFVQTRDFLKLHTPVISAKDYNALPDDLKELFVKVGK